MCEITGAMNIFCESMAFNYSVWLSYLMMKKVNNPTSNFVVLHLVTHIFTVIQSIVLVIAIYFTFGFGISVSIKLINYFFKLRHM